MAGKEIARLDAALSSDARPAAGAASARPSDARPAAFSADAQARAGMRPAASPAHAVQLEDRERLTVTGVQDVAGFDETAVVLSTALGGLCVRGEGMHIEKIDLEAGRLELRGKLCELSYEEPAGGGFWSRLFG